MANKVLCLSGGIDSFLAYQKMMECDVHFDTVFFRYGDYSEIEEKYVRDICPSVKVIDLPKELFETTDKKAYVPYRNLLFACLALGDKYDEVIIAGVRDDNVPDKNAVAFELMTEVLRGIGKNPRVKITSPFFNKTKSQVIREWLGHDGMKGNRERALKEKTFSCYSPIEDGKECLACPACFRKWCALWTNGVQYRFNNEELMQEYYSAALNGEYDNDRNEEIIGAITDYRENSKYSPKVYCFDIDGTLTIETDGIDYENRTPNLPMINWVNNLYAEGYTIILHSARHTEDDGITKEWLTKNGVKYHSCILGKPKADFYVDDRSMVVGSLSQPVSNIPGHCYEC